MKRSNTKMEYKAPLIETIVLTFPEMMVDQSSGISSMQNGGAIGYEYNY